MTVFDSAAAAAGGLLGGDAATGGWVLGLVLIVVLFVVFLFASYSPQGGSSFFASLVGLDIGLGFSVLVGWWPLWMAFFIIILIVFTWWARPAGTQGFG